MLSDDLRFFYGFVFTADLTEIKVTQTTFRVKTRHTNDLMGPFALLRISQRVYVFFFCSDF